MSMILQLPNQVCQLIAGIHTDTRSAIVLVGVNVGESGTVYSTSGPDGFDESFTKAVRFEIVDPGRRNVHVGVPEGS